MRWFCFYFGSCSFWHNHFLSFIDSSTNYYYWHIFCVVLQFRPTTSNSLPCPVAKTMFVLTSMSHLHYNSDTTPPSLHHSSFPCLPKRARTILDLVTFTYTHKMNDGEYLGVWCSLCLWTANTRLYAIAKICPSFGFSTNYLELWDCVYFVRHFILEVSRRSMKALPVVGYCGWIDSASFRKEYHNYGERALHDNILMHRQYG